MAIHRVELFGLARIVAGRPTVDVEVPDGSTVRAAMAVLAKQCPGLVGPVLLPDASSPGAGYTLSLDGRAFVEDLDTPLAPGDALLLLPAAAGG